MDVHCDSVVTKAKWEHLWRRCFNIDKFNPPFICVPADYKKVNWHYERPSKPTSRTHDDFISHTNEVMQKDVLRPMSHNKSYQGRFTFKEPYPMEIPMSKWGLYNPPHYDEPIRVNHFPPIKYDGYKWWGLLGLLTIIGDVWTQGTG